MDNEKEREVKVFTFPRQFENEARAIISQMIEKGLNGIEIPDSDGQVVIREKVAGAETAEFNERVGESDIIMLPIKVKVGDTVETFFVCSR